MPQGQARDVRLAVVSHSGRNRQRPWLRPAVPGGLRAWAASRLLPAKSRDGSQDARGPPWKPRAVLLTREGPLLSRAEELRAESDLGAGVDTGTPPWPRQEARWDAGHLPFLMSRHPAP